MTQSTAIVKQIDHLLIACRDPLALYRLFAETFRLPVTWVLKPYGGFVSGGLFCGNVDLEFLKLKLSDDFTTLLGIAFEPTPLEASLSELAARGIPADEPEPFEGVFPDGSRGILWRNVALLGFPGDSMIFLCARAPYAQDRRAGMQSGFDGGALGVKAVQQIVVGTTELPRSQRQWGNLLAPAPTPAPDLWQPGDGPAIALVKHHTDTLLRLIIEVESLARAREFLRANRLLGRESGSEITLEPACLDGLDIRLVGAS